MNKLITMTAATGLALTLGVSTLAPTISHAESRTGSIVQEDAYKTIKAFSKTDLEKLTGTPLTIQNVNKAYKRLQQTSTWTAAGYDKAKAQVIANRVSAYNYQLNGILLDIAKHTDKGLKVTYINSSWSPQVNFGTFSSHNDNNNDHGNVSPSEGILPVKEFDIEIEYKHHDIEIEYEKKDNGQIKAEFENEFTGQKLKGKAAQQLIEKLFADFDFHSKNKAQIVEYTLTHLQLDPNFKKFEFKEKFPNQSKFEFKIK